MAVIAVIAVASAIALEKSLPYRIGPANYARYLWAVRLSIVALVTPVLAIGLGIASRQRLPILLGVCSLVACYVFAPLSVHSGASPKAWCYFSLRRIDGAKAQVELQRNLTNGVVITAEELSPLIDGGFQSLKCYERGVYSIGPVGTDPRCSVHGSLSEISGDTPRRIQ